MQGLHIANIPHGVSRVYLNAVGTGMPARFSHKLDLKFRAPAMEVRFLDAKDGEVEMIGALIHVYFNIGRAERDRWQKGRVDEIAIWYAGEWTARWEMCPTGFDFNEQKDLFLQWDGSAWDELNILSSHYLYSVDMISDTGGWAVGGPDYDPEQDAWIGATLHWDGSTWQAIDNPAVGYLFSVDMLSSTDGWAVGHSGSQGDAAIIIHWDGVKLTSVPSPTHNLLESVSVLSASAGWAVGNDGTILHWNGNSWQMVSSPTTNHLTAVQMASPNDGWAMGDRGTILHWDGSGWQAVPSPTSRAPLSIFMLSSTDGWAVGDAAISFYTRSTIAHWDGKAWLEFSSPTAVGLSSVSLVSPDEGWAVGGGAILHYGGTAPKLQLPLIFHNHRVCGQQGLVNGNFEQDDVSWQLFTSGTHDNAHDLIGSIDEGFSPYAGEHAARLGGYEGVKDIICGPNC